MNGLKRLVWFVAGLVCGILLAYNIEYFKGINPSRIERDTIVVSKTDTIRDTLL